MRNSPVYSVIVVEIDGSLQQGAAKIYPPINRRAVFLFYRNC